ncbi:uncharacterized protein BO72DRAFT_173726 [Aspergillus fijiensis CBS 313.89]|uniref:Uncharacterized protein n=1 Tax=Aspergillus fijiensis CBS 313.89 TaxID=1448319 RepID=A0A8G1RMA8_9EURO|nr:uncharacterized protein BO72DRAFT_173726 [Aspergillus fijiensis CBS 313.89]RAK75283.1 hypothetical protein BO72DRAFT_173726 [Aspergillus fijiensis CBS 313.89]
MQPASKQATCGDNRQIKSGDEFLQPQSMIVYFLLAAEWWSDCFQARGGDALHPRRPGPRRRWPKQARNREMIRVCVVAVTAGCVGHMYVDMIEGCGWTK